MNKESKQIILMSLIPALLTLAFIASMFMPTFNKFNDVKGKISKTKNEIKDNNLKLNSLKQQKELFETIQALKDELSSFNVEVPSKDYLSILLFDLEKFAEPLNIKILSLNTKDETLIKLEDPNQTKKKKKSKRGKKQKESISDLPVLFTQIQLDIKVFGKYENIMKYISNLESYQRKISITSVNIKDYQKDKKVNSPRVEMMIKANVYKYIEQNVALPEKSDNKKKV